jgi:beta-lactam-binding protein with PASTA domain
MSDPNFYKVGYLTNCDTSGLAVGSLSEGGICNDESAFQLFVTASGYLNNTQQNFGLGCVDFSSGNGSGTPGTGIALPAVTSGGPIDLSTGDYTVEGWFYERQTSASILMSCTSGGGILEMPATAGVCTPTVDGVILSPGTFSLNAWHHHAIVRHANAVTYYIDGVATAAPASATPSSWVGTTFYVGQTQLGAAFGGMSNGVRITKGVARYTSNFTPNAAPFPGPPPPAVDPDFANVSVLLTLNGRQGQAFFTDVSTNQVPFVPYGGGAISQVAPLNFGSGVLNCGSGAGIFAYSDAINPPSGSPLDLAAGDFTVECFVNTNNAAALQYICQCLTSGGGAGYGIRLDNGGGFTGVFSMGSGATAVPDAGTPPTAGDWYHVAFCRVGNNFGMATNGVFGSTVSASGSIGAPTAPFCIGVTDYFTGLNGFVSQFRVTKGLSRYTPGTNFSPPTAAFGGTGPNIGGDPDFSSVSFLLDNSGLLPVDLSSVGNVLTLNPPQAANTISGSDFNSPIFLNNGSMSVTNGGGSAILSTPITTGGPLDISSGDFTIDGWLCSYGAGVDAIISALADVATGGIYFYEAGGGKLEFVFQGATYALVDTPTIATTNGAWVHFAFVSQGGTLGAFLNGQAGATVAQPAAGTAWGGNPLSVTYQANDFSLNGYRITKGVARYTPGTNFTPPTLPPGTPATMVAVPNVVGDLLATGEAAITGAGLSVGTVSTSYSGSVPAGYIISQSPTGGTMVSVGSSVDLVNSLGPPPPPVVVPNVVGLSQALASSNIITATLTVGTVTTASSGSVPAGDVISQSPVAGVGVSPATPVALVISTGAVATVPNLFNLSVATATATLTALGLNIGPISTQYDVIIVPGNIDAQGIAASTVVPVGTSVPVTVSLGRAPLFVPNLLGLTQGAADTLLLSLGLMPGAVGFAPSSEVESGLIMAQNPNAGNPIASGGLVSFVVSTGIPTVTKKFDFEATVISQYANSPTLLQLVSNMNDYIDQSTNFANFFNFVWNVDTAQGFGLDIWGNIVGVSRLLHIPTTFDYAGFDNSATPPPDWQTMGSDQPPQPAVGGAMYTGDNATQTYLLGDDAYRQLILAKAFANIAITSAPSINQILQNLYGPGAAWVLNTGVMTISYNLNFTPSAIQLAILEQSGIIPTPPGVAATVVIV